MSKAYSDKLKNPKWQKMRLLVMQRDSWRCCNCMDGSETLHVHHLSYEYGKDPWDYDISNFETLCSKCHSNKHGKTKPIIKSNERMFNAEEIRAIRTYLSFIPRVGRTIIANKFGCCKTTIKRIERGRAYTDIL